MKVVDLDRDTVKQGLADGSLLVIDVREPDETDGIVPGSLRIGTASNGATDGASFDWIQTLRQVT